MIKVIYLIDSLEGYGAEKSIVEIALRMKKTVPVFIHLYGRGNLIPKLEDGNVKVHSLDLDDSAGVLKAVKKISPIVAMEKPAIVHSTLHRSDLIARRLKTIFPEILLVGSFVSNSYGMNRYRHLSTISKLKLFSTQLRDFFSAGKVDYFVCNSFAIKKTNLKALKVNREKVKVIYRGRCLDDYSISTASLEKLRKELNLTNEKIFINVGRLHKLKGQLDLLKAFKLVHEKNPNTLLLIAGEGSLRPQLSSAVKDLELANSVKILGYREDITALLSLADFFVFPTYYEGLPGSLIEAIISKTPAIVSDIAENRECFEKDEALFFPPGEVNVMAERMEEALKTDDWEARTSRAANYANNKFDIEKITLEYEAFYEEILELNNHREKKATEPFS